MLRLLIILLVFTWNVSTGQNKELILTGKQVKVPNSNVKIIAKPVYLTAPYVITKVEGDTSGFWIENGKSEIIKSFRHSSDALNFTLDKGQYRVVPNLPSGKNSAEITVFLRRKNST